MVSFICDACQETVKKNKVDAHSWRCKNCWVLSCVDCGVRFEGEAYKAHTSCISEAEKYHTADPRQVLARRSSPEKRKTRSRDGLLQFTSPLRE